MRVHGKKLALVLGVVRVAQKHLAALVRALLDDGSFLGGLAAIAERPRALVGHEVLDVDLVVVKDHELAKRAPFRDNAVVAGPKLVALLAREERLVGRVEARPAVLRARGSSEHDAADEHVADALRVRDALRVDLLVKIAERVALARVAVVGGRVCARVRGTLRDYSLFHRINKKTDLDSI